MVEVGDGSVVEVSLCSGAVRRAGQISTAG